MGGNANEPSKPAQRAEMWAASYAFRACGQDLGRGSTLSPVRDGMFIDRDSMKDFSSNVRSGMSDCLSRATFRSLRSSELMGCCDYKHSAPTEPLPVIQEGHDVLDQDSLRKRSSRSRPAIKRITACPMATIPTYVAA